MNETQCPCCEGHDIVANVRIGQTAEVDKIGLKYTTALILVGTEPLLADLCLGCGTVTRLHVQNTDRKWITADS